ncbi:MAG: hypothetical protein ACRYG8_05990 [Janthinobacterium lividum]
MTAPSRRALLDTSCGTILATAATAIVMQPDARASEVLPLTYRADTPLLALCERFMAVQADIDVIDADRETDHTEELDKLTDAQMPLLNDMTDLTATSLEGIRARVRVLMAWFGGEGDVRCADMEWWTLAPLFRELLGEEV